LGQNSGWAAAGREWAAGRGCWAAAVCSLSFFSISNSYFQTYLNNKQISNSNQDLNPHTQKQCTSMYATVNSYISLIN
jgi:hypothetical protein